MARTAIAKTPLGQRLTAVREAAGYPHRKQFAELLGIHAETLGGYERGDSNPDIDFLAFYKQKFSVNLDWLIAGEGRMSDHVLDPASGSGTFLTHVMEGLSADKRLPAQLVAADFVNLPQYDVRASAGRGLIPFNEMPVSETAFERSFLRNLGGAPDFCFMMWSTGDSMLPTIPDNSLLIVDSSQNIVDHGRIYVFSVGNAIVVKRARWRMDGKLELASDNLSGNYPTETFDADRVEDFNVVGRVIFIGHSS
ncbi:transcriptional regulator [Rhizobium sp. Root708]|uniref:XRE family transcriptional regulator n=1 Tax=Rhizobium sp. Root708 TaxID=1736592 RepID=UPI0006F634C6|nr:LexA family transcriptional regulator [Rhizobium sp. Root708]KRB58492.1 transcriptional regulator [Rhizobium sp. Root708]